MRLLLFSDLHSDFQTASKLVTLSNKVDVVVGAGDFCIGRRGLGKIIDALAPIKKPTVLVPGNSESDEELLPGSLRAYSRQRGAGAPPGRNDRDKCRTRRHHSQF
jgi:predicted phosphodiesterase